MTVPAITPLKGTIAGYRSTRLDGGQFLERAPETKVVVVTPKSTVHQWASEIEKFTTGIRPIIVETKPKTKNGLTPYH